MITILLRFFLFSLGILIIVISSCERRKEKTDSTELNEIFKEDFSSAIELLKSEGPLIDTIAGFKQNEGEIVSIVFPEIIRWNAFQDIIETAVDESLYVNYGSADYSIGIFQMKPSFIEQLESYVAENNIGDCSFVRINERDSVAIRRERIKRLKQNYWQLKYAQVFWTVVQHRFEKLEFKTKEDQIHFFATAFNYGFRKPHDEIKVWQRKKAFPYGSTYSGLQGAYGDFSVLFYQNYSNY